MYAWKVTFRDGVDRFVMGNTAFVAMQRAVGVRVKAGHTVDTTHVVLVQQLAEVQA